MFITRSVTTFAVFLLASLPTHPQAPLTLLGRVALARPLLLHAEAAASAADPATRAFLLYRVAGAWLDLDVAHAVDLDRQAFAAALLIDSLPLRKGVEHDILSDLLPLSPAALLGVIAEADPETQNQLYRAAIHFSLLQGDLAQATKAFEQASAAGIFPERAIVHLLAAASQSSAAERVRIFNLALAAYKLQTPENSRYWTASRLVARYWESLPPESILAAIDIILARAAQKDKQQPIGSASIGSGSNSISYTSYIDPELFAVAPAFLKLDPSRAAKLLAAHPSAREYLNRFPGGLPSFDDTFFYANNESLGVGPRIPYGRNSFATEKGAHSSHDTPIDEGIEFTIPLNLEQGLGVNGATVSFASPDSPEGDLLGTDNTCPSDVPHILASIGVVPLSRRIPATCGGPNGAWCQYIDEYPRIDVLNKIAERCTYYLDKQAALSVLTAELDLLPQLPPNHRPDYLTNIADLYLRLGDRQAAAAVVQTGFGLAVSLFDQDDKSTKLQALPKAVWPSAEMYRRVISLGVNADFEEARVAVEAISAPDLRELERVMLARSLLGIPVRRRIIFSADGSSMRSQSEAEYEDL
jgi:hypothetical protein